MYSPTDLLNAQSPLRRKAISSQPAKEFKLDESKSHHLDEKSRKLGKLLMPWSRWNESQPSSSRMLAISIPAIKGIGRAIGASYQKAIQEVMAERKAELDELNQQWMLGARHNATVKGKDDVLRSIAKEKLGLENWKGVKFP